MKSIVVGTAGHIDHGKTSLVKALTGMDPDRLEEEKRRGITIDIGFAHLLTTSTSGEELRIAFVDVPGHEKFVRNMLAGVGGVDIVLMVIAADEGIKPQTREHFDICRLLHVPRGITVVTKSDSVNQEMLDVVRLEIGEFLRGSFLDVADPESSGAENRGAAMISVSAKTGGGLDALKAELVRMADLIPGRNSRGLFRLPVDRAFAMKGHGTVVTGTLISGTVAKEDEVEVQPGGKHLRVRGVQVHGSSTEQASAGQRTALNLAAATAQELSRGTVLVPPGVLESTTKADVHLMLLKNAKPLRDRAKVHLHCHTAQTIAEVVIAAISGKNELQPGESAFAQLKLAEPLLLLPGDRFIIRQFSPVVTIGGGLVLDAVSFNKKMVRAQRLAYLQTLAAGNHQASLFARVSRRDTDGLSISQAIAETGWTKEEIAELSAGLQREKGILFVDQTLISTTAFQAASEALLSTLTAFHNRNPLAAGIGSEELRAKLKQTAPVFQAILRHLTESKRLVATGEQLHLAGRSVVMRDEETKAKEIIEKAFFSAGLKVPALKEVMQQLPIDRIRAQKIVTLMLRDKLLIKVTDDLVFHASALQELKRKLSEFKTRTPKIDVGQFKDLTGVSRKYAIPLLEYLDRERLTRRVGDARVIL